MNVAAEDQLNMVAQLIQSLLADYYRNPTMHVVAPHLSLLQVWLQIEQKRSGRDEQMDRIRSDNP